MREITYLLLVISALAARAATAVAEDMQFFDGTIDYWRQAEVVEPQMAQRPEAPVPDAAKKPFPWANYLDPMNKEFFREGDYTPPEPFMEIVRDPSDRNLRMWFTYIEKKNALGERLARRVQEYLQANSASVTGIGTLQPTPGPKSAS